MPHPDFCVDPVDAVARVADCDEGWMAISGAAATTAVAETDDPVGGALIVAVCENAARVAVAGRPDRAAGTFAFFLTGANARAADQPSRLVSATV